MKTLILSLVVGGLLATRGAGAAEHDKSCQNVHGRVTVVTEDGVTVNDKMYKVGKSTRITKNDKVVKLENLSAGDLVCLDVRGKDDIGGGEVAAITVLNASAPVPPRERKVVREKQTITKGGQIATFATMEGGDFVCLDGGHDQDVTATLGTVLNPAETAPFNWREIIREQEDS